MNGGQVYGSQWDGFQSNGFRLFEVRNNKTFFESKLCQKIKIFIKIKKKNYFYYFNDKNDSSHTINLNSCIIFVKKNNCHPEIGIILLSQPCL